MFYWLADQELLRFLVALPVALGILLWLITSPYWKER